MKENPEHFHLPSISLQSPDNEILPFEEIKRPYNLFVFYDEGKPEAHSAVECMEKISKSYPNWYLSVIGVPDNGESESKVNDKSNFFKALEDVPEMSRALDLNEDSSMCLIDSNGDVIKICRSVNESNINKISEEIAKSLYCDPVIIRLDNN